MFNLFDNAVKYASTTPEIRLRTQNVGKYLVITFSDNGIGIPNEKINKVFDKFYRVQSGNIHDVKGFGLGLYYVKEVLKQTKATIAVSSKLHVGTVFTIRFLNVSVHD